MQDKTMVNDTLTGINGELVRFGEMIPQTENKELKQTLKAGSVADVFRQLKKEVDDYYGESN